MNRFLPVIVALMLMGSCTATQATAQQLPSNTNCNDQSALAWSMNAEADMDHYNVYSSNVPIDVTADNTTLILLQVPQPAPGETEVTYPLNSTLSDGEKYFRVSAVDQAGNESAFSNEAGCMYDKIPSAPVNIRVILSP